MDVHFKWERDVTAPVYEERVELFGLVGMVSIVSRDKWLDGDELEILIKESGSPGRLYRSLLSKRTRIDEAKVMCEVEMMNFIAKDIKRTKPEFGE